ncbi:hypothetical protein C8C85_0059 [Flavobacterium sp. 103]|nr:hypothetical protein C8C85_0059 [Flavobacterium sp. 103]
MRQTLLFSILFKKKSYSFKVLLHYNNFIQHKPKHQFTFLKIFKIINQYNILLKSTYTSYSSINQRKKLNCLCFSLKKTSKIKNPASIMLEQDLI